MRYPVEQREQRTITTRTSAGNPTSPTRAIRKCTPLRAPYRNIQATRATTRDMSSTDPGEPFFLLQMRFQILAQWSVRFILEIGITIDQVESQLAHALE